LIGEDNQNLYSGVLIIIHAGGVVDNIHTGSVQAIQTGGLQIPNSIIGLGAQGYITNDQNVLDSNVT
jgi:hypothetical protein